MIGEKRNVKTIYIFKLKYLKVQKQGRGMSNKQYSTWGYERIFLFYCSVGLLDCIFIALLALSNEGVRAHFFFLLDTHAKAPKSKNIAPLAF